MEKNIYLVLLFSCEKCTLVNIKKRPNLVILNTFNLTGCSSFNDTISNAKIPADSWMCNAHEELLLVCSSIIVSVVTVVEFHSKAGESQ